MSIAEAVAAAAIAATLALVAADPVIDIANAAITELNRIGRGERARQEQIRTVACETFPNECPPPVPAWADAPKIGQP